VAKVLEEIPKGEVFGASYLAAEVNRRFGKALRKPANAQLVSATLRCLHANGLVHRVRKAPAGPRRSTPGFEERSSGRLRPQTVLIAARSPRK
jgi:hypothetical protein